MKESIWVSIDDLKSDDWVNADVDSSDSLETTAAVVLFEMTLRSILKGVFALLIDASALKFTLVEFHDISILMLMISSVSFAWLRKDTLVYSIWVRNTHIATMHSINSVRNFILFMFTMQWKDSSRTNMFFIDHISSTSILNSQAPIMNARSRSTFWIETQSESITSMTQSKSTPMWV
jgi:hypothetical protein